jgi:hypothetical protein
VRPRGRKSTQHHPLADGRNPLWHRHSDADEREDYLLAGGVWGELLRCWRWIAATVALFHQPATALVQVNMMLRYPKAL